VSDEQRATPRRRTLKGARIVINDGFSTLECTVRNLSESGARLQLPSVVGIPDSFQLLMDDGRSFACTIAWKTGTEIGVRFG
jgi:hypothetical protein